jgi:hypothetical protein
MRGDGRCWAKSHLRVGGRRRRLLLGLTLAIGLLLAMDSFASAMTIGLNWEGTNSNLDAVHSSGASVYHEPLAYYGPGNWAADDSQVEEAWKRGLTIVPTLSRESGPGETRFLRSGDPGWAAWGTWAREAVERYGVNGSFWSGKANPTPITAWEVWNEPNRIEENPKISESECAAEGMTYLPWAGTCYQPKAYGSFLKYTGEAIQAGSYTKTAHGTEVLFGGLYTPGGYEFMRYVELAASVPEVAGSFTGIAIHPYSLVSGLSEFEMTVRKARNWSNEIGLSGKSLWLTEMGWPVGGTENFPTNGHPVSEGEQATLLTQSFNWLKSVAGTYNIPLAAWFNIRDYNTGNKWPGYCGLLDGNGNPRPAWNAFRQQTLQSESSPPLLGVVLNSGEAVAKEGNLAAAWTAESGGTRSMAVANSYIHGPLIGLETASGTLFAKQGNLAAEWVEEFGGIKQIAVASDPVHGPLIAVLTNSGVLWVKQGSLTSGWVEEFGGIKSISVGTDPVNGPIIGAVTETGRAFVKEGSLTGAWVEEQTGIETISVASDPSTGPVIGVLTSSGTAMVKEGSLYGEWVEEFGGIKALSVASDRINGALIGVLTNGGTFWAKQGSLTGEWVEEFGGIKQISVASDPYNGPLIGAVTNGSVAFVKEGNLRGGWVEETPGAQQVSVAG